MKHGRRFVLVFCLVIGLGPVASGETCSSFFEPIPVTRLPRKIDSTDAVITQLPPNSSSTVESGLVRIGNFEIVRLKPDVYGSGRRTENTEFYDFVVRFAQFFRELQFEINTSTLSVVRPSDSATFSKVIDDYNRKRPRRRQLLAKFWDDLSRSGVASDETFVRLYRDQRALPIQQIFGGTHVHDQAEHVIPALLIPNIVLERSQFNQKVLNALLGDPRLSGESALRQNIFKTRLIVIEQSMTGAFRSLLADDLANVVMNWNFLILSQAQIQKMVPRYLSRQQKRIVESYLRMLKPELSPAEIRAAWETLDRRLAGG
jgi:hypothetical protein